MNNFEHQETMRPRDWGEAQGIFWKKMIFWKNKFPLPYPSLLVSWSHGESYKLFYKVKRFFNTVFVDFQPKHLFIQKFSDHCWSQILKINSPSPTPVSWSRGLMVNLPSTFIKLKDFLKKVFIDLHSIHEQLWRPRDHETKRLVWSSRNLLKKISFEKINSPSPTPVSWSLGLMVNLARTLIKLKDF